MRLSQSLENLSILKKRCNGANVAHHCLPLLTFAPVFPFLLALSIVSELTRDLVMLRMEMHCTCIHQNVSAHVNVHHAVSTKICSQPLWATGWAAVHVSYGVMSAPISQLGLRLITHSPVGAHIHPPKISASSTGNWECSATCTRTKLTL